MIKRINLLEKEPLSFTYQQLLQICLAVILLNTLVFGMQHFRLNKIKPQIDIERKRVSDLKNKRDKLQKMQNRPIIKKKIPKKGQYSQLINHLESIPNWSKLLSELSWKLPNSVWVTSFKNAKGRSSPQKDPNAPPLKKKKNVKTPQNDNIAVTQNYLVEIVGNSRSARGISEFISNLEKSPYFSTVTLTHSQKSADGFNFSIKSSIVASYVE